MRFEDNVLFYYMKPLWVGPATLPCSIYKDAQDRGYITSWFTPELYMHDITLSGLWFLKLYEKSHQTTGFDSAGKTFYSLDSYADHYRLFLKLKEEERALTRI